MFLLLMSVSQTTSLRFWDYLSSSSEPMSIISLWNLKIHKKKKIISAQLRYPSFGSFFFFPRLEEVLCKGLVALRMIKCSNNLLSGKYSGILYILPEITN